MAFHIIIPARYRSSRLANKVLADIGGKSMLEHVFMRAQESGADSVVIAADDEQVQQVAEGFGATVCMTQTEHPSGSDRIAETVNLLDYDDDDIIVGLQADEPFVPSSVIRQLASEIEDRDNIKVASLCHEIKDVADLFNPAVVKVVLNHRRNAMYFSRAPIPWERGNFSLEQLPEKMQTVHYRHIGMYAYRAGFLSQFLQMEACEIEEAECLEQLRVLWNAGRIHMAVVKNVVPHGVDTEADLKAARAFHKKHYSRS